MDKTIEESAAEYAGEFVKKHNLYNPELLQVIVDSYKASAERIMSLPLASRLTADEKERVRTKYNAAKIGATEFDNPECAYMMDLLECIFGKDFFKENKQ